jgi:hypothetical protein
MNKRQRKKLERRTSLRKRFRDWRRGKTKMRITSVYEDGTKTVIWETYPQWVKRSKDNP